MEIQTYRENSQVLVLHIWKNKLWVRFPNHRHALVFRSFICRVTYSCASYVMRLICEAWVIHAIDTMLGGEWGGGGGGGGGGGDWGGGGTKEVHLHGGVVLP